MANLFFFPNLCACARWVKVFSSYNQNMHEGEFLSWSEFYLKNRSLEYKQSEKLSFEVPTFKMIFSFKKCKLAP